MSTAIAVDTTIAVVTPENIAFDYQLAGPFRRLPAYLIDLVVRWGIVFGLVVIIWLIGGLIDLSGMSAYTRAVLLISHFMLAHFYGTFMECYFNGKTVGKWSCGIRVVNVDGSPVDLRGAFLRNLLRVADLAPYVLLSTVIQNAPPMFFVPTGVLGVATMMCTRRMQRLGDLAAGTMVIVDEREWALPTTSVPDPRVPALASFIPADYLITRGMARTLAVYVERRQHLSPQRRREIAKKLTIPLADRFGFRDDIDPDLLMMALYYQHFLHESSGDPVDLSPLAGFSPLAPTTASENEEETAETNSELVDPPPGSGHVTSPETAS